MKDKIVEISLAGFLRSGIRKMTIQKLVSPLGISTKTVYKYFEDKEALLKECLTLHYTPLVNALQESMEASPNAVHAILVCWNLTMEADFGVNRSFYHDLNYYFPSLQDEVLKKYANKISNLIAKKLRMVYNKVSS